ncbi:MAG: hypothetical protein KGJ72_11855, partial [Gammaproteobacteria bacterium]|nr:hypothetical protein [Gammaproteobacteria bacterium]
MRGRAAGRPWRQSRFLGPFNLADADLRGPALPARALAASLLALACLPLASCATHRPSEDKQAVEIPQFPTPPADGAIFHTGYSAG